MEVSVRKKKMCGIGKEERLVNSKLKGYALK
jgi:hypothetical protein